MPVEEDVFYDVDGYEVSRTNLVQQMIQYYEEKLEIGETKVTDFNEGSEIRNLLEAIAVDVYNLMEEQNDLTSIMFIETAEGEWLDKHGANPFINLPRNTGVEATGFVTFSIPAVMTSDVVIGGGTVLVCTDNSLYYVTDTDIIISVGDTSATVSATCLTTGADGNCPADTITLIEDESLTVNGLTVTNEESFTGGEDYEEDIDYRERLLNYVRKDDFGSYGYYVTLGENVIGVHDVALVDYPNYTKQVLVNGDEKPVSDEVLVDVLSEYTNPDNIVLGHSFTVAKPNYLVKDLTLNLTVTEELAEDEILEFLTGYFNGGDVLIGITFDGLSIGEALIKDSLYESFSIIDTIENVEIIDNETGAELEDITIEENEVLQLGDVTINQQVV